MSIGVWFEALKLVPSEVGMVISGPVSSAAGRIFYYYVYFFIDSE